MATAPDLVVIDSRAQPAALCVVCGNDVGAGEGVTASYRGRILRFRCTGCLTRFQADPEPFLAGHTGGCCGGQHDHSPASEWQ